MQNMSSMCLLSIVTVIWIFFSLPMFNTHTLLIVPIIIPHVWIMCVLIPTISYVFCLWSTGYLAYFFSLFCSCCKSKFSISTWLKSKFKGRWYFVKVLSFCYFSPKEFCGFHSLSGILCHRFSLGYPDSNSLYFLNQPWSHDTLGLTIWNLNHHFP